MLERLAGKSGGFCSNPPEGHLEFRLEQGKWRRGWCGGGRWSLSVPPTPGSLPKSLSHGPLLGKTQAVDWQH